MQLRNGNREAAISVMNQLGSASIQEREWTLRILRAAIDAYGGDHAAASLAATEECSEVEANELGPDCIPAVVAAFCARSVLRDESLSIDQRTALSDRYQGHSLELLVQAKERNFFRSPLRRSWVERTVEFEAFKDGVTEILRR